MGALKYLALLAILATTLVYAIPEDLERRKKAIGIFNLVQFPNDECEGSTAGTFGTCYTSEECSERNGVSSGSFADGYGVCCVITLACGGRSAENCTYLTETAATDDCTYTICPRDATINRIRLDLTMFQIASPSSPTDSSGDAAASTQTSRAAVGHCTVDSFSVTGAPTICGTNSGQHIFVDTDGTACVKATFSLGGDAGQTRSYNIHVRQFARSNMDGGGRTGCLQWFTEDTGTVSTFNWQGVGAASTHLANQNYNVCVRKNVGRCSICYSAMTTGSATISGSFGLSNGKSDGADAKSGAGTSCSQTTSTNPNDSGDFVVIQGGATAASATPAVVNAALTGIGGARFCGRFLNDAAAGAQGDVTICSNRTPFQLSVHTDGIEAAADTGAQAGKNELADGSADATLNGPLGTNGFQLVFQQVACS